MLRITIKVYQYHPLSEFAYFVVPLWNKKSRANKVAISCMATFLLSIIVPDKRRQRSYTFWALIRDTCNSRQKSLRHSQKIAKNIVLAEFKPFVHSRILFSHKLTLFRGRRGTGIKCRIETAEVPSHQPYKSGSY